MTEYGLPFDGLLTGDATKAPYSAAEWARVWKLMHGLGISFPNYGVFKGSGDGTYEPLLVLADSPVSAAIKVQIGAGMIDGRFYENTAVVSLTVAANASGNTRIDTVILRLDYTLQTVRLVVKQGTPAASPVHPTLQQDASFWEIPLADVSVVNGFTTLAQSTIAQRQRDVITAPRGWQPYAFPAVYVPNGSYDAATLSVSTNGVNGLAVAIPVLLSANILLDNVAIRASGAAVAYEIGWDIYKQDVNEGNTAENTLRRVAQSNGNSTGTLTGGNQTLTIPVMGTIIALDPGMYWLVLQNRHTTNNFNLNVVAAAATFAPTAHKTKGIPLAGPGQTIDMVTGWSTQTTVPGVRLQGRVFGQTSVF